jgi:hypothetical protein
MQNLLPDFASNAGKVLGSTGSGIGWVAQTGGGNSAYMTPDYSSMGTSNILTISGNTGTWTADKLGYITCSTVTTGAGQSGMYINVNGKRVLSHYVYPVTQNDVRTTIPVAENDSVVVTAVGTLTSFGCYFIPPKYSTPPTPIVVEGGDYKTAEQAVMVNDGGTVRPKLWVDGVSQIYQKTIAWTSVNVSADTAVKFADAGDVKLVTSSEAISSLGTTGAPVYVAGGTDLTMRNNYSSAWVAGAQWYITIQYIKN